MKKIKIIYADYDELNAKIKNWQEKNPKYEIISTVLAKGEGYTTVISIVYDDGAQSGMMLS